MGTARSLSRLFVYPLKAAGAIELRDTTLDTFGLSGDRRWVLIGTDGRALTQREHPRLATVRVRLFGTALEVSAPGREPLRVEIPGGGPRVAVRVWEAACEGTPAGAVASAWFSDLLDADCRLVYMPPDVIRPVSPSYGRPGDRVGFADGYPLLLIGEGSLSDLNSRLRQPIPADRFRANLVVGGTEPFEEDRWDRIRIGTCTFRVVKPCARCVVTTIDQQTGIRGSEPLRTLAGYRKKGNRVLFGQNLIHDAPGSVAVEDAVEVLSWRATT